MCTLNKSYLNTPCGILLLTCCHRGVHSMNMKNSADSDSKLKSLELNDGADGDSEMTNAIVWLQNYFEAPCKVHENVPTICPTVFSTKGKFTEKVWKTLFSEVPFGTTVSYGGLAELCGKKSASRAVGTAMKNNPIAILIPCHRVIKSDGSIGHYSGKEGMKEWLLKHEKVLI